MKVLFLDPKSILEKHYSQFLTLAQSKYSWQPLTLLRGIPQLGVKNGLDLVALLGDGPLDIAQLLSIHANMRLHAEVPLITLLGLVHLRVA